MRGQINANMAATIPQKFNIVSISKVTFDLFFKPVVSGRFGRLETSYSFDYNHILLYPETRRFLLLSIIFCFYVAVVTFINYSGMDKRMDLNNDKC